jgi:hypothetical protein
MLFDPSFMGFVFVSADFGRASVGSCIIRRSVQICRIFPQRLDSSFRICYNNGRYGG